jgi:radical SAM protein with 4Fe4S-binding SPASM domain
MGHFRKNCISFLMTDACSMRCKYCYLGNKKTIPKGNNVGKIDVDFAKKGLEDFFSDTSSKNIRYFGEGEPTLEIDRMQEIQEYAESIMGDDLFTELQTNGFFSMEVAKWCAKNLDIIWISMDGIPEIHDKYRKTIDGKKTAHIIERNIQYLSDKIIVGVRSTIGRSNIHRQKDNIDYFHNLGVKAVFADHLCVPVSKDAKSTDDLIEVKPLEFANNFLDAKKYAEGKGIFYSNFFCVNFDERVDIACRAMLPAPHLTPNGYVSCCDMATRLDGVLDELIYGKYDQRTKRIIYDEQKIAKIRSRKKTNIPECQSCEAIDNCAGGCLGEAINETKNFYGIKKNLCEVTRYLAKILKSDNGLYKFIHP